jgi:hypothetical protein
MPQDNLKPGEAQDHIIDGLKYFQDNWSKDDPNFPYDGELPQQVSKIWEKMFMRFYRVKAGRFFLEDAFPENALKKYSGEIKTSSIEPIIEKISKTIKANQTAIKLEAYKLINNIENQEERKIFYDFYMEGKTASEIAEERELNEDTVYHITRRIRTEIRQLYDME